MNKALEIIEAHYLFDLKPEQIEVLIHPQCSVHAFVQFKNGNILAHFGYPDMKIPLSYALFYPNTKEHGGFKRPDLTEGKLEFFKPDTKKFPSINFAYAALKKGHAACRKLNQANSQAVEKFIKKEIGFLEIFKIIGRSY
jgi:1-deoxy-D-xylulose-5-phosphate reductoisomerase